MNQDTRHGSFFATGGPQVMRDMPPPPPREIVREEFQTENDLVTRASATPFNPCIGEPRMANFLKRGDKLPALIATLMYKELPENLYGYSLVKRSAHTAVYVADGHAIIGLRGTAIGQSGMVRDIQDDIKIGFGAGCDLAIVKEGRLIMDDLIRQGYSITLAGHSLGGRAAICLGESLGVINVVALNAGAPVINPDYKTGSNPGTNYHIFGDFISTHVYGMDTVRVYKEKVKGVDVDWLDPWYHSTDRFLADEGFLYASPQMEQDDLEDFIYRRGNLRLQLLDIGTSLLSFSWYQQAKEKVCEDPIPGAVMGEECSRVNSPLHLFGKYFMAAAAGALAGLLLGPGAAATAFFLVKGIYENNLTAVLDAIIPEFSLASKAVRASIETILHENADLTDIIPKLVSVGL